MKLLTRLTSLGALGLLVAASASGCAMSTPMMLTWDDTSAMVSWTNDSGMDALLTGKITIDDAGCWAMSDGTGTVHQVIWPKGTTLDDEGLHVPGLGDALQPGIMVDAGGGEVDAANLGDLPSCWDSRTPVFVSWQVIPSR